MPHGLCRSPWSTRWAANRAGLAVAAILAVGACGQSSAVLAGNDHAARRGHRVDVAPRRGAAVRFAYVRYIKLPHLPGQYVVSYGGIPYFYVDDSPECTPATVGYDGFYGCGPGSPFSIY